MRCCFQSLFLLGGVFILASMLCGCDSVAFRDQRDERDPLMRKAAVLRDLQRIDEAIAAYESALQRRPGLATAHLELANLYSDYRRDYIRAIYHYQTYLAARPQAEKKDLIEDLITESKAALAASLNTGRKDLERELAQVRAENARLKDQLLTLQKAATTPPPPVAPTPPARPTNITTNIIKPTTVPAPTRIMAYHTVIRGDTMKRIAAQYYGSSEKWQPIFEANRDKLTSPDKVCLGQRLKIPMLPVTGAGSGGNSP